MTHADDCTCACHDQSARHTPDCDQEGGCGCSMAEHAHLCAVRHRRNPEQHRRTLDPSLLCKGCHDHLVEIVAQLPAHWSDLPEAIGGSSPLTTRVTGTAEEPLPAGRHLFSLQRQIMERLFSWCVMVADYTHTSRPSSRSPYITAEWLGKHLDWCVTQDWIADMRTELMDLLNRAKAAVDPARKVTAVVGPCNWILSDDDSHEMYDPAGFPLRCPGTLVSVIHTNDDLLPAVISCDTCAREIPADQWLTEGRRQRAIAKEAV